MGVKNSISLLLWFALDWFLVRWTFFVSPYIYSLCRFPCQWIICSFSLCILLLSFCFLVGILHILQKPHLNQLLLFLICALDFNLVSLGPETLFYYHQIYPFVFSCSLYFFNDIFSHGMIQCVLGVSLHHSETVWKHAFLNLGIGPMW